MKRALVIVLLLAQTLTWANLELAATNPFTHELVYVDWSTLQIVAGSRRVWMLVDWGEPDENGIRFVYGEHEYQCREGRTRSLALVFYAEQSVLPVGRDPQPGKWSSPTRYSLAGVVLAAVCGEGRAPAAEP